MSALQWQHPELLWLLALMPLWAVLVGRVGRAAAVLFSSAAIVRKVAGKRRSRAGAILLSLRLLALAGLIVALAGPRIGQGHEEIEASGIDIVLTIDISQSMAAMDFSTEEDYVTRLDIVKRTVREFIEKRPADRIGIIAFANYSYIISPLTLNHDWLLKNLERLELGLIDGSATAIGSAIGASANRLRELTSKSKVVILLTDGEDNVSTIPPIAAAEAAAAENVKIYTIAAGRSGRVPVPRIRDGVVVRDSQGKPVFTGNYQASRVDEKTLREIADITNGTFYSATNRQELRRIYEDIDRLEKSEITRYQYETYTEYFYVPLLIGLGLLALEQALANTRLRRLP